MWQTLSAPWLFSLAVVITGFLNHESNQASLRSSDCSVSHCWDTKAKPHRVALRDPSQSSPQPLQTHPWGQLHWPSSLALDVVCPFDGSALSHRLDHTLEGPPSFYPFLLLLLKSSLSFGTQSLFWCPQAGSVSPPPMSHCPPSWQRPWATDSHSPRHHCTHTWEEMATAWLSWEVVWGGTWVWAWPLCASFTHLQIGVSVAPASFFRPNESVYNVLPCRASTRKGMLAFVVTVVGFSLPFTPVSSLSHRQCLTHSQCLKHKRLSVTAGDAAVLPPHRVTWHLSPALLAHHCVPSCWDTWAGTEVGGKRCSFLREGSERVRAGLLHF